MSETTTAVEVVSSAAAPKVMYGGAAGSVIGWAAQIDWIAVIGVVIGLSGFIINSYFQYKKSKREELESILRMQREQDKHEIEMKKLAGDYDAKN